jgi:hypothetical protein
VQLNEKFKNLETLTADVLTEDFDLNLSLLYTVLYNQGGGVEISDLPN